MKKKIFFIVILCLVSAMLWAGGESENNKSITFTFAHNHKENGMYHIGAMKFKELVEFRSKNMVIINIFLGGQLGADREIQEGIELGTIDMGISSSPVASINDYAKLLDAPYLFVNREHISEVLDGSLGKRMSVPLEQKNIKQLAFWENGFRQITNNKRPINIPSDLSGLKLRTPENAVRLETFRTFGANPTPMSFKEVFGALQQGVIDGQENPLAVINQGSLFEVQEYLSISNHVYSAAHFLMNKEKFDALSQNLQTILIDAAVETAKYTRKVGQEQDGTLINKLQQDGMKVNNANTAAFVDAGQVVWENIVSSNTYTDAQEILDEIASLGQKYLQ